MIKLSLNKKEAARFYKLLSEKGNEETMNRYAEMLYNGTGIDVDKKEAARLYKLSGEKGNDHALLCYANMLLSGDGIPQNE